MKSISAVAIATIAVAGMVVDAYASDWPSRPVRIVAPAAPGGASDLLGRILAPHLSEILNQQFYIENRSGAGGLIGSALVANAPPDGYTFLTSNVGYIVTGPMTVAKSPFERLNTATYQVLQMPEIRKRMAEDGIETRMMTPTEYTSFIASEVMKWSPIAKRKTQ